MVPKVLYLNKLLIEREGMFMKEQKIFTIIFSLIVVIFVGINVFANNNNIGQSIDEEESKVDEKEGQLNEIQSLLNKLNNSKNDLSEYMTNLNNSYDKISSYITTLQKDISEKQIQIDNINIELKKAEEEEKQQYEAMKLRIKYMYESGNYSYYNALFSDGTLSDVLNQVEYVSSLIKYDRDKLDEYQDLLVYISATKINLEDEITELQKIAEDQRAQQDSMVLIMSEAALNIKSKEAEIDEAESKAAKFALEIQKSKDSIQELKAEESRRIEESIRQSSEKASKEAEGIYEESTTAPKYEATDDEVMKMAAILYCEARGEPYQGILAVGSVIMNRVADPRFPNTIEEVIMSPNQFSPVASGLYAIALAKGANETCIKAAKEVLEDGVRIGPWLYFRTINNIIQGTIIGNHVFYYR